MYKSDYFCLHEKFKKGSLTKAFCLKLLLDNTIYMNFLNHSLLHWKIFISIK